MSSVLEVSDLEVSYHDGTRALRGVSMQIAPAQRVALIGSNGAGKSTLLLALMGALHYSGSIRVDGIALSPKTVEQVRSRCGMVFQDAEDQLFSPTLLEDVAFGPLNQGHSAHAARAKAMEAIAAVGLEGLENKPAHHLSGGQKRCAALATILSMQVQVLLLDEPGANLDFRSRRRLMDLLSTRREAQLIATHDLDMVRRLCTRVILLHDGLVVADGPTGAILADSDLLRKHAMAD